MDPQVCCKHRLPSAGRRAVVHLACCCVAGLRRCAGWYSPSQPHCSPPLAPCAGAPLRVHRPGGLQVRHPQHAPAGGSQRRRACACRPGWGVLCLRTVGTACPALHPPCRACCRSGSWTRSRLTPTWSWWARTATWAPPSPRWARARVCVAVLAAGNYCMRYCCLLHVLLLHRWNVLPGMCCLECAAC